MAKATPEQIEEWQKKHGDIFEICVDGKFGYVKTPDRKTMGYASSLQSNPIRSNEVLLNGCWVGGDEEIKTDDSLFMSVQHMLGGLIQLKEATLVKL